MHLLIDGYGGNVDALWDRSLINDFLSDYPARLGMTVVSPPKTVVYNAPQEQDSGVTGFVIIAESHISLHTFPNRRYANLDFFSCKSFDHERALAEVERLFGFQRVKSWVVDRGLEFYDRQMMMPAMAVSGARRPESL